MTEGCSASARRRSLQLFALSPALLLFVNPVSRFHCCRRNFTREELKLTFYCTKAALQSGASHPALFEQARTRRTRRRVCVCVCV